MPLYIFQGIIHPERVNFTIGVSVPFSIKHIELGIEGETIIEIIDSKIKVEYNSDTAFNQPTLESIKNMIEGNARLVVDAYCFVNSYSYDVEITRVECEEINLDYTFGVRGEWNIKKTKEKSNEEFTDILFLYSKPERMFLKDVLADFRRAIKYPDMTASFCFRAIETIRQFYFEDFSIQNEKRRKILGWEKLRARLNIHEGDFDQIKEFALPNRHGKYPYISYNERERIMNFTRVIIERLIEDIKNSSD